MGKDARESTSLNERVTARLRNLSRAERQGAMKSNESDNAKSNPGNGMLSPGEPDAGKACTSGSEGRVEKRTERQRALPLLYTL
jgi:hypothetical protein